MLSGTACGRLLYGGLVVALAMDAFPRLNLLALGAVALLVAFIDTQNTRCRTDGSSLLSHQHPWHSRMSRALQQHSPRLGVRSSHRTSVTPFCRLQTFRISASITACPLAARRLCRTMRQDHTLQDRNTYSVPPCSGTQVARFPPLSPQPVRCHA